MLAKAIENIFQLIDSKAFFEATFGFVWKYLLTFNLDPHNLGTIGHSEGAGEFQSHAPLFLISSRPQFPIDLVHRFKQINPNEMNWTYPDSPAPENHAFLVIAFTNPGRIE